MKKFLTQTGFFIPFAVLAYVVMLFAWAALAPHWLKSNLNYRIGSYGHMQTRMKEVKTSRDVDVLFLGSSHAYRGFDPRIFEERNLKTFNLGSSSQTPLQTRVLLKRYLSQLNPDYVIYEVYPETFSLDGVESSLDIIANDRNDRYSLDMAWEIQHPKTWNTLVYGAIRDWLNLNAAFTEPLSKDGDTYIPGGYVQSAMHYFGNISHPKQNLVLNELQTKAFKDNVWLMKEAGAEVIMVYAPVTRSLYRSYEGSTGFDSLMENVGAYYNFNNLMQLDDSLHFYDAHHLNQIGVELFNRKLLEVIPLSAE